MNRPPPFNRGIHAAYSAPFPLRLREMTSGRLIEVMLESGMF